MIYQLAVAEGVQRTIVIRPNRSMSWGELVLAFTIISAVTIGVGIFCFIIGLPLVLPFSGVEIIVLGAVFYLSAWQGGIQEVVTIGPDAVAVESGRAHPESRQEFQRHWARVVLEQSWRGWYPSRLLIRSHGRQVEIGRFLNEQERQGLALELRAAMTQGQAWPGNEPKTA